MTRIYNIFSSIRMKHHCLSASSLLFALILFLSIEFLHCPAVQAGKSDLPQRIVSLGPTNTENVFLLGAGNRLVGNTHYCVRPEEAKKVKKVGSVLTFSLEKLIALEPDVILATGLTYTNQLDHLKKLGYRVEIFPQPNSLEQSCNYLIRLGKILGLEAKARTIVQEVQQSVSNLQKSVKELAKPTVFLQIGTQPLHGADSTSFVSDFITLAGGINILENQTRGETHVEKIIANDPDVIIIAIMGSETGVAAQEKSKWQKMKILKAARKERIYIIDPDVTCSPSPRTFAQTLKIIAELLHPPQSS